MSKYNTVEWDDIPDYTLRNTPDDLPLKTYRLAAIKRALKAGYARTRDAAPGDLCDYVTNALADLRHLCDALGIDFGDLDRRATGHHSAEKEQITQPPSPSSPADPNGPA
jgi:hypothetical protein